MNVRTYGDAERGEARTTIIPAVKPRGLYSIQPVQRMRWWVLTEDESMIAEFRSTGPS